jgi:hypothetical protein
MTVERDLERAVRAWVAQGSEQLPDPALDAALEEISITPQRRARWLARRFPPMNRYVLRFGIAAVGIIVVGVIGLSLLPGHVGGPAPTPMPTPAFTLASGKFTAPLLASGVSTVDINAVAYEQRPNGGGSRSPAPASGSMEVSDVDGGFSVDLQCTRWDEYYTLLIGGEVTESTHGAAAEGSRVLIAFHPRTVITALLWFENAPAAPTCGAFLQSISMTNEVANDMEPVDGLMNVGTYVADCDGRGCTEIPR